MPKHTPRRLCGLLAVTLIILPAIAMAAPLDDYMTKPDPSFCWEYAAKFTDNDCAVHVLRMQSQTWRSQSEVDRPLWEHWLIMIVPPEVSWNTAMLFIGGGGNDEDAPDKADSMLLEFARGSRSIVCELRQVPNQPLIFAGETEDRKEDGILSYTWDRFLKTGDPSWLGRFPMTKAAVRAMDVVEVAARERAGREIDGFVVAGGSKRGWTTWSAAAVDKRVKAIAPIVIDMLNMRPSMKSHHEAYGFWAPAIGDYERMGLMDKMETPEMSQLLLHEDPYSFRDRFTMPKYIVNATGDQFFRPESSRFYFGDLPGEKYLRYVPNADHGLGGSDAARSILAWYAAFLAGTPRPEFTWTRTESPEEARFEVRTVTQPIEVRLWTGTNPDSRDFRLETTGPVWESTLLTPGLDGVYEAKVAKPEKGWTAAMVELTFHGPAQELPFKMTTDVAVVPGQ